MGSYYQKKQGNKELNDSISSNDEEHAPERLLDLDVPQNYRKEEGMLDPSLFIIVSGGEVREKDYFSFFDNKIYSFPRIIIEFVSKNPEGEGGLDVNKLIKVALQIKKEKEESKGDDILDSINVVTDVDHFYSQIIANLPECNKNNISLIISNPCFEIWLYYTYYQDTPDFKIPQNKKKISSEFKTYLGNKHRGGVDPRKAPLNIDQAINNSSTNYSIDTNGIPVLFSTQMHFLASKLYELTKEEIIKIKKEKEQQKRNYISRNKEL